jgi:Asp-tRNA(Asn)/Glu-tRNA(Gln) amidotransferase A subunit family amidase
LSGDLNALITPVEPAAPRAGPLRGRTLVVKDLFDTAGVRTTYEIGRAHV